MDADQRGLNSKQNQPGFGYSDPIVIGAGAFFLGFVIGSGRWNWFGKEAGKIASSLGTLALNSIAKSFQEHNPNLFSERSRMTH